MKPSDSRYLLAPVLGLALGIAWLFCIAVLAAFLDKSPGFSLYTSVYHVLWVVGSAFVSWWVMRRYGVRRPVTTVAASIGLTLVASSFGYVWLPTLFAPFIFAACFLVAAFAVDLVPAHVNGPLRGRRPQGPVQ